MRQPMRRTTALLATAALALSLSACTAGQWVADSPPAAGVQVDDGGLKLRNFLVVTDGSGEAMLLGSITSRDEAVDIATITVAPEKSDGSFGQAQDLQFSNQVAEGKTIMLNGADMTFTNPDVTMGRLADVNVAFSNGKVLNLKAPVLSAEHADFAEAWSEAKA